MAKKAFLITGVPGTGKTTLALALSKKMRVSLIEINELAELLGLYTHTDPADGAKVVRLRSLGRELAAAIKSEKKTVIVEGHLGCDMELPVQKVLVLRCEPKALRQRLAPRGYSADKLAQNALSEALDYCVALSEKNYGARKVFELDTTKKSEKEVLFEAERILSGKKKKKEKFSWPDALLREAIAGEKIRKALKG
jgi:adenylate kinase